MSIIAEFSVPSGEFALTRALRAAPKMIVEIERVVAHADDRVMPFFWVRGGAFDEFESAMEEDSTVRDVTRLDVLDRGSLYRAEWTEHVASIIYAYTEIGATIIEATGRGSAWELRMRFDDHESLSAFQEYCSNEGLSFTLNRFYQPSEPMSGGQFGLSEKQHNALIAALDSGYYDIPRATTMAELATDLNISQQSLSKRFRRAHRNLISNVLTISHPDDRTDS